MSEFVVFVTCPPEKASELASTLVEQRLVACVNILEGITSVYRWEGKVQTDGESLLLIKTTDQRIEGLQAEILRIHPYDCPEFVAVAIDKISPGYLEWLGQSVAGD